MAKASSRTAKKTVHRSSISGRFVTPQHAKKHPNTTQKEKR